MMPKSYIPRSDYIFQDDGVVVDGGDHLSHLLFPPFLR